MSDTQLNLRVALLATLVARSGQPPGRTALMKFAYLLQAVRRVPLGYDFRLYTYGPYDASVLSDLSLATSMKAIKSETVYYPSGSGYAYSVNDKGIEKVCEAAGDELKKYDQDIAWVLNEFGGATASRLELVATIIFAVQEMRRKRQTFSNAELESRVRRIKPHFSAEIISETIAELASKAILSSEAPVACS